MLLRRARATATLSGLTLDPYLKSKVADVCFEMYIFLDPLYYRSERWADRIGYVYLAPTICWVTLRATASVLHQRLAARSWFSTHDYSRSICRNHPR